MFMIFYAMLSSWFKGTGVAPYIKSKAAVYNYVLTITCVCSNFLTANLNWQLKAN